MKAFAVKIEPTTDQRVYGLKAVARVLGPYASMRTLVRYGLKRLPAGKYHVELYRDNNKVYGPPDETFNYFA